MTFACEETHRSRTACDCHATPSTITHSDGDGTRTRMAGDENGTSRAWFHGRGQGTRRRPGHWRREGRCLSPAKRENFPTTSAFAGLIVAAAAAAVSCLPGASAMSAGANHSCAVITDGSVKCWGSNALGQLGQPDSITRGRQPWEMGDNLPSVPLGTFEASTVAAGEYFTCALSAEGQVKCWGENEYGQLGLGDTEQRGGVSDTEYPFEMGDSLLTVDVGTNLTVESLSLGSGHACAVLTGGDLKCWGSNEFGQLGLGDTENRGDDFGEMGNNLPFVDLGTGFRVTSVALGHKHTCAIVEDGGVKCWGNSNGGQLGYEDTIARGDGPNEMGDNLNLVDLGREKKALAVTAGALYTCALLYTGDFKCWGFNSDGQLGQGSTTSIGDAVDTMGDFLPPIDLGAGRKALAVAAGSVHACAVLDDETIKCFGGNVLGSLGLGDNVSRGATPGQMGDNLPAVLLNFGAGEGAVSNAVAGGYHTCVSGMLGGMTCFGYNAFGQLGAGISTKTKIGDDPGETEALDEIDLGTNVTVVVPDAPGAGITFVTISPTPAPKPSAETESIWYEDFGEGRSTTIGIICAAIMVSIVSVVSVFCCCHRCRHRKHQKQRKSEEAPKSIAASNSRDPGGKQERRLEEGTDGSTPDPAPPSPSAPPVKDSCSTAVVDTSVRTVDMSAHVQIRPASAKATTTTKATALATIKVTGTATAAAAAIGSARMARDDDYVSDSDVSSSSSSDLSSITPGSMSSASSFSTSVGFMTPARTKIFRSNKGIPLDNDEDNANTASDRVLNAVATAAETTEPDTSSPNSWISSIDDIPNPPEIMLAHFMKASIDSETLHGLPVVSMGNSSSTLLEPSSGGDSNLPLPMPESNNGGSTPLPASTATVASTAAAAVSATGGAEDSGTGRPGPATNQRRRQ